MTHWESFLASLATRGGNIFLLLLINIGLGALVYHVLHHNEISAPTATVIMSTFSTFTGALMNALQGGSNKQRTSDNNGNGKLEEKK